MSLESRAKRWVGVNQPKWEGQDFLGGEGGLYKGPEAGRRLRGAQGTEVGQ